MHHFKANTDNENNDFFIAAGINKPTQTLSVFFFNFSHAFIFRKIMNPLTKTIATSLVSQSGIFVR